MCEACNTSAIAGSTPGRERPPSLKATTADDQSAISACINTACRVCCRADGKGGSRRYACMHQKLARGGACTNPRCVHPTHAHTTHTHTCTHTHHTYAHTHCPGSHATQNTVTSIVTCFEGAACTCTYVNAVPPLSPPEASIQACQPLPGDSCIFQISDNHWKASPHARMHPKLQVNRFHTRYVRNNVCCTPLASFDGRLHDLKNANIPRTPSSPAS